MGESRDATSFNVEERVLASSLAEPISATSIRNFATVCSSSTRSASLPEGHTPTTPCCWSVALEERRSVCSTVRPSPATASPSWPSGSSSLSSSKSSSYSSASLTLPLPAASLCPALTLSCALAFTPTAGSMRVSVLARALEAEVSSRPAPQLLASAPSRAEDLGVCGSGSSFGGHRATRNDCSAKHSLHSASERVHDAASSALLLVASLPATPLPLGAATSSAGCCSLNTTASSGAVATTAAGRCVYGSATQRSAAAEDSAAASSMSGSAADSLAAALGCAAPAPRSSYIAANCCSPARCVAASSIRDFAACSSCICRVMSLSFSSSVSTRGSSGSAAGLGGRFFFAARREGAPGEGDTNAAPPCEANGELSCACLGGAFAATT
mmetsp:Transcript_15022/g.34429  ORF Transcript_15022/g.34429 Transcript_15022/m.34429 type:complete len:385 (-) Transcript_15022:964-2118(-)